MIGGPETRLPLAAALLAVAATGCGSDFRPPDLETTDRPAGPLGQVIDVDVTLPNLLVDGARGVTLDLVLEVEEVGFGRLDARIRPGGASWNGGSGPLEIVSSPVTTVNVTPDRWSTGRMGPFTLAGTAFEMALDGEPRDGGWRATGTAWESQTGIAGTFEAWRRQRFLVATTDFFAGGRVAEVSWTRGRELQRRDRLERVSSDPVLRVTGGAVFAVNRFTFDNVQRLDPTADFATAWQRGTGPGSNPHDVLVLDDGRAYVTRYEPPFDDVAVLDPRTGATTGAIALGDLAENPDGTPRAHTMAAAEGAVFVVLQDIDRTFTRYGEGKLAVIDPLLDEVTGVVALGGRNPGAIEVLPGGDGRDRLWVALGGIFPGLRPAELSGGVVVVHAFNRAVERLALDDDDAGGNVAALAMASPELGYVVVSDEDFVNRVLAFDAARGVVLREVWRTADFVPELELGGSGILAVPDRAFAGPRLCLWRVPVNPQDAETPLGCAGLSLPPVSIEALD